MMDKPTNLKKHAYIIIAHSNIYTLNKLISSLDDIRNDIFIHIDPKSSINVADVCKTQKSNIKVFKQVSVYWGHVSLIEVEIFLYEYASQFASYSYYHLLSGADLPIKNQDFIHDFFDKHEGKEFIGFSAASIDMEKINKIHIFPKSQRVTERQYLKRLKRKLRSAFLSFQRMINFNNIKKIPLEFRFGSDWTSLTQNLVLDLISNKNTFYKMYKYSSCSDEIYKQTYVFNSTYNDNVYDISDELNSCQRLMDWKRGNPYTFRLEDLEEIKNSPFLFARKFDDVIDKDIIDQIVEGNKLLD